MPMRTTSRSFRLPRTIAPPLAALTAAVLTAAFAAGPASAAQRVHEAPVPTPQAGPFGIALGPGGTMWFTESLADAVGVVHKDGSIREFALPAGSHPQQITPGPDGNMWFTLLNGNAID